MRLWLCLLLLCSVAGRAVADDDEEGGVFNPGTPVPWRITIDASDKTHQVVTGPSGGTFVTDVAFTVNATYIIQVPPGGTDYGFGIDPSSKTDVTVSSSGTVHSETTVNGQTAHATGALSWLHLDFQYHSKSGRFAVDLSPRYRDSTGHESSEHVTFGDLLGKRTGTVTKTGNKIAADYDANMSGPAGSFDAHVHIKAEPMTVSKYVAVLLPANRDVYNTWLPLGPTIPGDDEAKGGNDLDLVLQVREKATNKLSGVHYTATWKISGTKLPGWCMNYPAKSKANDHWDLYFDPKKNPGRKVQDDGEELVVGEIGGEQHAIISSRDYGGHAVVSATVMVDGAPLIAHEDTGKTTFGEPGIRVPKDDNQNHIADAWESDNGVMGKDATDDDDATPAGMFNKGDGINDFEEYRGFAMLDHKQLILHAAASESTVGVRTVFQRLDPKVKEAFVMIEGPEGIAPSLLFGAMRFGVVTGITIYAISDVELLEPMPGDETDRPRTLTTRIDTSDADFGLPQAVVWVTTRLTPKKPSPAYTPFVRDDPNDVAYKHHGSPTEVKGVEIFVKNSEDQLKFWMSIFADVPKFPGSNKRFDELAQQHPEWHLTREALQSYATAHFTELEHDFFAWTTMHELGHAFGGRHHDAGMGAGDGACPMRYWNEADPQYVAMFLSGHWKLTDHDPTGADWKFCSEDWPDMRVWQQPDDIDARGKH